MRVPWLPHRRREQWRGLETETAGVIKTKARYFFSGGVAFSLLGSLVAGLAEGAFCFRSS
jgi:hypothetical protein